MTTTVHFYYAQTGDEFYRDYATETGSAEKQRMIKDVMSYTNKGYYITYGGQIPPATAPAETQAKKEPLPVAYSQLNIVQPTEPYAEPTQTLYGVPLPKIGLAETLAQIKVKPLVDVPRLLGVPRTPQEALTPPSMRKETVRPFAGIAGVIAPFESTAYLIRLAGVPTPRPPPTLISFAPQKAMEYGPEYAAGTLAGDVLLSMALGKVTSKIWEYTPKIIKAPITKVAETIAKPFHPITKPILKMLEENFFGPPSRLSPGIVDIPEFAKPLPKELMYQEWAWELVETPKTSALLISKYSGQTGERVSSWVAEHWLKTVTGGLSYALVKQEIEEITPISERASLPYMPSVEPIKTTTLLFPLLRLQQTTETKLETVPTLKPKVFEESYEIQKLRLFPQLYPKQKERQTQIYVPKLSMAQLTRVTQKMEPLQLPKQLQKLAPAMPTPTRTIPSFPSFPATFRLPHGGEDLSRMQRGLFGKWFKRSHALPTEKQIMRSLGFGIGKKRGKRRGATRRRR